MNVESFVSGKKGKVIALFPVNPFAAPHRYIYIKKKNFNASKRAK